MGSLNKVMFIGRLVADPETRYTASEKPVTHFRIAVDRPTKDGEKSADFFNCIAWNGLAKICEEYLKKGRLVAVEGRLQIRSYEDKEGQKKTATEVVASNIQMLDWAKKAKAAA